jgi:hypothetical protein
LSFSKKGLVQRIPSVRSFARRGLKQLDGGPGVIVFARTPGDGKMGRRLAGHFVVVEVGSKDGLKCWIELAIPG